MSLLNPWTSWNTAAAAASTQRWISRVEATSAPEVLIVMVEGGQLMNLPPAPQNTVWKLSAPSVTLSTTASPPAPVKAPMTFKRDIVLPVLYPSQITFLCQWLVRKKPVEPIESTQNVQSSAALALQPGYVINKPFNMGHCMGACQRFCPTKHLGGGRWELDIRIPWASWPWTIGLTKHGSMVTWKANSVKKVDLNASADVFPDLHIGSSFLLHCSPYCL